MYGFLSQACPPEAPLREGQCVCFDLTRQWDVLQQECVPKRPTMLTTRPTGRRGGGGTALFIGLLLVAGAAAVVLATNPELTESLVTP